MELTALNRCVAALDVHQAKLTVCMMFENELGEVVSETKKFGGFKKDRLVMAEWGFI
jgi:transposase